MRVGSLVTWDGTVQLNTSRQILAKLSCGCWAQFSRPNSTPELCSPNENEYLGSRGGFPGKKLVYSWTKGPSLLDISIVAGYGVPN